MLKLERRPEASELWRYGSPLLALLITVALGIGLFVLLGKDVLLVAALLSLRSKMNCRTVALGFHESWRRVWPCSNGNLRGSE